MSNGIVQTMDGFSVQRTCVKESCYFHTQEYQSYLPFQDSQMLKKKALNSFATAILFLLLIFLFVA